MRGEAVVVVRKVASKKDIYNNTCYAEKVQVVDDVLVAPASTDDLLANNRPDSKIASLTLYFPKSYNEALKGSSIIVRGKKYSVVGNPIWYEPNETPGKWNYPVLVEVVDG